MPRNLPERASYEYLKKLAKERLALLRTRNAGAKLADAQLSIAREYGFSSWRALKAEMDIRQAPHVAEFMRVHGRRSRNASRVVTARSRARA